MPEVVIDVPTAISGRILRALETAKANAPEDLRLTTYWQKFLSMASIRVDGDKVTLRGESGFYYPGASYSRLELLNTLYKLPWLKRYREAGSALDNGLPGGMGYRFSGRRVNYDYLRAQYHLYSILGADAGLPRDPVFLEIGSGTGILASAAMQAFPRATYILVDLPGILAFASFFLSKAFPDKTFKFYHEWKSEGMTGADFVFVPFYEIGSVPSASVDMVLNTDSMQEMNMETISRYFAEMRRVLRGPRLFYQSNRKSKLMDGKAIEVDGFPYVPGDAHLFKRDNEFMRTQWVQRRIFRVLPAIRKARVHHVQSLTRMAPSDVVGAAQASMSGERLSSSP